MSDEPEVLGGEDSEEVYTESFEDETASDVSLQSEVSDVSEDLQGRDDFMGLFFPSEESIAVILYAYISRSAGRPKIFGVMRVKMPALVEGGMEEYEIRSSWSVPMAGEMDGYRAEASEYRAQDQSFMVNTLLLRDIIVSCHLKALLLPPDYTPFSLSYTRRNRLSPETMKRLKKLHSGIYDALYAEFQSEACLVV